MDVGKKKQVEIRKAAALRSQHSGGLPIPPVKVGQKRKHSTNGGQSSKKVLGPANRQNQEEMVQKMPNPPCHGVGKGLMTSQGPIANPHVPLLVRSKGFAMDTTPSLVQDGNLDECSEHKTEALSDSGLGKDKGPLDYVCCIEGVG